MTAPRTAFIVYLNLNVADDKFRNEDRTMDSLRAILENTIGNRFPSVEAAPDSVPMPDDNARRRAFMITVDLDITWMAGDRRLAHSAVRTILRERLPSYCSPVLSHALARLQPGYVEADPKTIEGQITE